MKFSRFEPFKVLAHYPKLVDLSRGNFVDPVQMIVYPSNVCKLNCGHCIMRDLRKGNEMLPAATMAKLVKDAIRLGIKHVNFSGGGEPLTNPRTIPTIKKLREVGIETSLNTSLTTECEGLEVDYIRISVDSGSREGYKRVHGFDGWEAMNRNLEQLGDHKELGLAFLVRHDNMGELIPFLDWAQQFPYTFIHVRPAYWPEHDESIQKVMANIISCKDDLESQYHGLTIAADKFKGYWTPRNFNKCRACGLKAVLTAEGRFMVCQDRFIKFGDYNNKTFEECWYSEDHRDALDIIDLDSCPRCVEVNTNEIIEHCVMEDGLKLGLI